MIDQTWRLSPLHLDHAWALSDLGDSPFPLEVRNHGATMDERDQLRRKAADELYELGAVSGDRLAVELQEALRLLAFRRCWVDSLWVTDPAAGRMVRLLGAIEGRRAVLAVQLPGADLDTPGDLVLSEIEPSALVSEVIGSLPAARRGGHAGGTLPASAWTGRRTGDDRILRSMGEGDDRDGLTQRALAKLLDTPHVHSGQFAANARDRHGARHRSEVVTWFDNPDDGRYVVVPRTGRATERWVTVAPADGGYLQKRLHDALDEVSAE